MQGGLSEISKKMGRPTDNPKPNKITFRIDSADKEILDKYIRQKSVTQTQALRSAIKLLENELKIQ